MQMNYIALIPAYKPTPILLELLDKLKALGFAIVLVNDGSGTEYEHLFFECSRNAEVLHHSQNAGKGCALKTGLAYIHKHYPRTSVVVTVDADGQHRAEDALAICRIAESHPNILVLGSRKLKENVPLRSQFGNTVTRFVYRVSTGLKVHDTQTGLRAFDMSLVQNLLETSGERYEYEMNVLLHFAREKIRIIEHEIETVYIDNNAGSHFDAVKDSFRIYKEILKFSASSFVGYLVDYAAYSILLLWGNLRIANGLARVISASVNFTINRRFVFQSRGKLLPAAIKYFLLAAVILCGNTLLLEFLVNMCSVNQMLAKVITEIVFFILSWSVQRLVVFKKRAGGDGK